MTHNAQAPYFFVHAVGVVDVPCARDELRGNRARVFNGDAVGENIHLIRWRGLFGLVLWADIHLKTVGWHESL